VSTSSATGTAAAARATPAPRAPDRHRRRLRTSIASRARSIPAAAWACGLTAFLSAACWSLVTPPFQAPDEPAHFAYVEHLAETGELPTREFSYPAAETSVLLSLDQGNLALHPEVKASLPSSARRQLRSSLETKSLSRSAPAGAGVAGTEPPLYYALAAVPYRVGMTLTGNLLDSLELMQLLSAVFAGVTALFSYMFVRETLPAVRWAWAVGGLGAALTPVLGFTSGAVTPDALLCAVAAAIFYCLARAFRRGLTLRLALVIGVLVAAGTLTKLNFLGLVPGVVLGMVALGLRGRARPDRAGASRSLAAAGAGVAIGLSPGAAYAAYKLLGAHDLLGPFSNSASSLAEHGSLWSKLVYIWEYYLPRLPGMAHGFIGISTPRLWFDRTVGLYGWLDTSFPGWAMDAAILPAALIVALALRALLARRSCLRPRLAEAITYATMGAGLLALIATTANMSVETEQIGYVQPRYLLPLLPLGALGLALAARGAGRRWGAAVGVLIVLGILAHDVFSQLLVVSRFYG
jgi:hypothetical protein